MVNITLVIVVQKDDLQVFKQTVKSINLFLKGITTAIIYVQDTAIDLFESISFVFPCTYIPIPFHFHEIPQKMIIRMMSYTDINTEYVMFLNPGLLFTEKLDVENFFV